MPTSISHDDGTSNVDRISQEIDMATCDIEERFQGYRARVAAAAVKCFRLAAEHDETRTNINQQYDQIIKELALEVGRRLAEGSER